MYIYIYIYISEHRNRKELEEGEALLATGGGSHSPEPLTSGSSLSPFCLSPSHPGCGYRAVVKFRKCPPKGPGFCLSPPPHTSASSSLLTSQL